MSTSRRPASDLAARIRGTISHAPGGAAPATPTEPTPSPGPPPARRRRPARAQEAPPAPPAPDTTREAPAWPPRRSARPPTTRYTIDVEQRHRDALRDLSRDLDVPASAIVRALLDLVGEDPALAARLGARVGGQT